MTQLDLPLLLWTPQSVTYLTEWIMSVMVLGLVANAALRARQDPGRRKVLGFLLIGFIGFSSFILLNLLRSALLPIYQAYVLPPISVSGLIAVSGMMQFAYRAPEGIAPRLRERAWAGAATLLIIGSEAAYAIYRYVALGQGDVVLRPKEMDYPMLAAYGWLVALTLRNIAQLRAKGALADVQTSARGIFVFALIPATMSVITLLRANGLVPIGVAEPANVLAGLLGLSAFSLMFLNHFSRSEPFSTKIGAVVMAFVMTIFALIALASSVVLLESYRAKSEDWSARSLLFTPVSAGQYRVQVLPVQRENGAERALPYGFSTYEMPFDLSFFGADYRRLFLRPEGMVGLQDHAIWGASLHRLAPRPTLFPMAVALAEVLPKTAARNAGIWAIEAQDQVVIRWRNIPSAQVPQLLFSFDMVLRRDGTIRFDLHHIPLVPQDMFEIHQSPVFVGISRGWLQGGGLGAEVATLIDTPLRMTRDGEGLIDSPFLTFRSFISRAYQPLAGLVLVFSALVVVLVPLFMRGALAQPLERLLSAMQAFRAGRFQGALAVQGGDEIGILTHNFNWMAAEHMGLLRDLEAQVARRAAQASDLASRNARLEERNRISSDLHDAVSQTLFSAALLAERLGQIERAGGEDMRGHLQQLAQMNRSALSEMRDLLAELRGGVAGDVPLGAALRGLIAGQGQSQTQAHDRAAQIEADIGGDAPLPPDVQMVFLRVAQEALNNCAKHAAGADVRISYDSVGSAALMVIEDQGAGFDMGAARAGHFGLDIMAERARKVGAMLEVASNTGQGTRVTLIWGEFGDEAGGRGGTYTDG